MSLICEITDWAYDKCKFLESCKDWSDWVGVQADLRVIDIHLYFYFILFNVPLLTSYPVMIKKMFRSHSVCKAQPTSGRYERKRFPIPAHFSLFSAEGEV